MAVPAEWSRWTRRISLWNEEMDGRLARMLERHGFTCLQDVSRWVGRGGDLLDLPNIGPDRAEAIKRAFVRYRLPGAEPPDWCGLPDDVVSRIRSAGFSSLLILAAWLSDGHSLGEIRRLGERRRRLVMEKLRAFGLSPERFERLPTPAQIAHSGRPDTIDNVSVRAAHALSCLDLRSWSEVSNYVMAGGSFSRVKNCGRKTVSEIIEGTRAAGFPVPQEAVR